MSTLPHHSLGSVMDIYYVILKHKSVNAVQTVEAFGKGCELFDKFATCIEETQPNSRDSVMPLDRM